ncbi:hypothetical protein UPYG_G00073180 [Umbra pygmaea]|uniref:Platelet-derived growth factor receptor-like protein n=1 Tax=Umbra pygmaea TaxID=75934 RepID=A0ABD0XF96_UMBPY
MIGYMFVVLLGFLGSALAKGKADREPKGKFSIPALDVKSGPIVLEANQTLTITCRGRWELSWALPSAMIGGQEKVKLEDSRCGKQRQHYCSQLTLSYAQAKHTGSYRCRYRHQSRKQNAVYIYIADSRRPFVEEEKSIPEVLYINEGKPLVFPCRVTNPDARVSLVKQYPDSHVLKPDQRNIVWNSRRGFIIRSPTLFYVGMFSCKTSLNGTTHSISYLTHRQVNKIRDMYLNISSPHEALQGERLTINCTVTAEWNSRVSFKWDYPSKANSSNIIYEEMLKSKTHLVFYSLLSIPKLHSSNKGLFICQVFSGPVKREVNASVKVYDRPFIRLKARHGVCCRGSCRTEVLPSISKTTGFSCPKSHLV